MSFGNKIGFELNGKLAEEELFSPEYGALVLEVKEQAEVSELFSGLNFKLIGRTISDKKYLLADLEIDLEEALESWQKPLEKIYPTKVKTIKEEAELINKEENAEKKKDKKENREVEIDQEAEIDKSAENSDDLLNFEPYTKGAKIKANIKTAKPKVLIPVFPGTNCEYDTARQFREAGAEIETFIFKNLEPQQIEDSISAIAESINNSQMVVIPGGFSAGDEPDGSGKFIAAVFRNPQIKEAVMDLLNNRDGLMLGICNGFQALIKLGLVPYGEIRELSDDAPTLTYNTIGRHISRMADTKITSNKSPWLANVEVGDIHSIAFSHGEGRFTADRELIKELQANGQIATQYVDFEGNPSMDIEFNPNGSVAAVEGITSPDGRVFGKMGHSERIGSNIAKNIVGKKDQKIFKAGVDYFRK